MKSLILIFMFLLSFSTFAANNCGPMGDHHEQKSKILNTKDMKFYEIALKLSSGNFVLKNDASEISEWTCLYLAYTNFSADGLTNGDSVIVNGKRATIVALSSQEYKGEKLFYVKFEGEESVNSSAWTRGSIY